MARKKYKKNKMNGKNNVAGLPQEVMMKNYPSYDAVADGKLDDTIVGIDKQMGTDISQMRKHMSKEKY